VACEKSSVVARAKVADQAGKEELVLQLIQRHDLSYRLGFVTFQ
jgi:hypothetical protein